jgi:16S rRNA (cytidine1402-2'-O)-methyltransferase
MLGKIYEKLDMGLDLALVSDSGTPLISDPGFKLVRDLREKDYEIIPIPGPSALISALSVSGIPTDKFTYLGFLPKSDVKRKKILNEYLDIQTSLVFYESPNRLMRLFYMLKDVFGEKKIFVARDMTKLRERFEYGNVSDVILKYEKDMFDVDPHGEYVVILQTK